MSQFRNLTDDEVHRLEATGCSASSWSDVWVAADFCTEQLAACHLEGRVRIASGARIYRSRVRNYDIGERSLVADVTALECRHASPFGNGVPVATMNEGGGRTVKIFTALSAQTAYLAALYRHRPQLVAALEHLEDGVQVVAAVGLVEVLHILQHGGGDALEAGCAVSLENFALNVVAQGLFVGQKVAHTF